MLKNLIGYWAFFFSAFLLFCYLRLPADALVEKVVHDYVNTDRGFSLDIGEVVSVGLGGASFRDLRLNFGSRDAQASPVNDSSIMIERLDIDVGLFSLIGQALEMEVEADIFGGELESQINVPFSALQGGSKSKRKGKDAEGQDEENKSTSIDLKFKDFELEKIPRPAGTLGLEFFGAISGELKADSNAGDLRRAGIAGILEKGKLKLKGDGIAVKKGNLKLRGLGPMMSSGLEVPDLKIGGLVVDVGFNKGVAEIEELSNKQSGNLFVDMGGKVTLRRNIGRSRLDLCFKVKGEPRFLAREKKIQSLLELASVQLKRDAKGFLTIPLKGTFTRIRPPRGVCKIK